MKKKRVISFDQTAFKSHCNLLFDLITKSGYRIDLMIGIKEGGWIVAKETGFNRIFPIESHRPSTTTKKKFVSKIIKVLPQWVNDILRIFESFVLEYKRTYLKPDQNYYSNVEIGKDVIDKIQGFKGNILLIDDAVDSGVTLKCCKEAIRKIAPLSIIKTAVITVTQNNTVIKPDFFIYNKVLIRFPWSLDAK